MAIQLEKTEFDQICDILARLPEFAQPSSRTNFVEGAFQDYPKATALISRLVWPGAQRTDAEILVRSLSNFGNLESMPALCVFLQHVQGSVGDEEAVLLDGLIQKYTVVPAVKTSLSNTDITWQGNLLPVMCDRVEQHRLFRKQFRHELRKPDALARSPIQLYVVCGREPDRHESLAKRLHHDVVRRDVEGESAGRDVAKFVEGTIGFTGKCDADDLDEQIQNDIFDKFKLSYARAEARGAEDLRRLLRPEKKQMYALQFKVRKWDDCADEFLRGQIRYWRGLTPARSGPRFVVFVHFVYKNAARAEAVRRQLANVLAQEKVAGWCHLMDDLGPVEKDHILELFEENPPPNNISALACGKAMFSRDEEVHDMNCIEARIQHICENINRPVNPLAGLPACLCE